MQKPFLEIEKILHIKLTDFQKECYPAFKWLVNDNTPIVDPVGKTFLLAVCFIEDALEHRNKWVYPFDNVPRHTILQEEIMKLIYRKILNNNRLSDLVIMEKNRFKFIDGEI